MDYVLLTFPRSGSHYLQQLIYQKTGLFIEKTHHISEINGRSVISIIRKPEDTFRSMVAMDKYFVNNPDVGIGLPIDDYVSFYKYITDLSEILVSYDDLVSYPEKILRSIAKRLSLDVNDMEYQDVLVDQPHYKHLVSSKTYDQYEKIDLSKFNMFEPNESYVKALRECISI